MRTVKGMGCENNAIVGGGRTCIYTLGKVNGIATFRKVAVQIDGDKK